MTAAIQTTLIPEEPYNNKGLFADHYLVERLRSLPEWTDAKGVDEVLQKIAELYSKNASQFTKNTNEPQTEKEFIQPVLDVLWGKDCYKVQVTIPNVDSRRQPDYAFFRSPEDSKPAQPHLGKIEYWKDVPVLGDAKAWFTSLDKQRGANENPTAQICSYLYRSKVRWGILTNGRIWRLYEREKSSAGGIFYEVDLENLLKSGNPENFKYFYLFFRCEAFLPDAEGAYFVEKVFRESVNYATNVGKNLKESVYDALRLMMNGFFEYPHNELDRNNPEQVKSVHGNSLIVLYRLLFLLYAEDRDLLPCKAEPYSNYSLLHLHKEIHDRLKAGGTYLPHVNDIWNRLLSLFSLIDRGYPEGKIPAYNGGLFDSTKHPQVAYEPQSDVKRWEIGDHRLAEVIDMLAYQRENWDEPGDEDIDYATLDVQHLGSIYEGLLELHPDVAEEDLMEVLEKGKPIFKPSREVPSPKRIRGKSPHGIKAGEVYLATASGERKATGSYYTPKYIVDYIVENTIGPLADQAAEQVKELLPGVKKEIEKLEKARNSFIKSKDPNAQKQITDKVKLMDSERRKLFNPYLSLKILDPAMGSGHFLVGAADYLSLAMATDPNLLPLEEMGDEEPQAFYKRLIVERCLYGVDLNPLAVELAKLSLWLHTVSKDKALSFLDHHLRCGNSLIGARVEDDLMTAPPILNPKTRKVKAATAGAQLPFAEALTALHLQYFLDTFRMIVEKPTGDADSERMKDKWYQEMDAVRDKFRQVANCWLAPYFGQPVSREQYEEAVNALRDSEIQWQALTKEDWFRNSQKIAKGKNFFHWELEFPEAFFEPHGFKPKEAQGFDAVIGNPPYGALFDTLESNYIQMNYHYVCYRSESYVAFMELVINLCHIDARSSLIVPDNWMYLDFTETLRKGLIEKGLLEHIIALPSSVFPDAAVDTSVYVHYRTRQIQDKSEINMMSFSKHLKIESISEGNQSSISLSEWKAWPQTVLNPFLLVRERGIISKCRSISEHLIRIATINYGLKAYQIGKGNPRQTIKEMREKPFTSNSLLSSEFYPFLEGSEIYRFDCMWSEDNWIKWGEWLAEPRSSDLFTGERLLFRKVVSHQLYGTKVVDTIYSNTLLYVIKTLSSTEWSSSSLLAVLNSTLIGFCFRSIFAICPDDIFPQILLKDFEGLPIRRISFTTPASDRTRLLEESRRLYETHLTSGNPDELLSFVSAQLSAKPERSDVIHDLLAFLAEQMIEMNKQKQVEVKGFVTWLERQIGAKTNDLNNKTKLQAYHNCDLATLLDVLRQNRRKLTIDPNSRSFQESFGHELTNSMEKLTPLKSRLALTDRLIDQIVYKLYGLTEDEITIVEGKK